MSSNIVYNDNSANKCSTLSNDNVQCRITFVLQTNEKKVFFLAVSAGPAILWGPLQL